MKKEAIIIVPGLNSKVAGTILDQVVNQLADHKEIEVSTKKNQNNHQTQSLELTFIDQEQEEKEIDVYEVFWGDIINENSNPEKSLFKKLVFGFELIVFWFFSKIWRAALSNKFIFVGICFSGIVILIWYLSIIGLVISSIFEYSSFSDFIPNFLKLFSSEKAAENLAKEVSEENFVKPLLGVIIALMAIFPTAIILKMSGFTMKYLKSSLVRDKVTDRIEKQMNALMKDDKYNRITIFSHSIGTIPVVDFFANFENKSNSKIRSVTTGAPASFLALKSPRINECLQLCSTNPHINEWWDYFSTEDYMCSYRNVDDLGVDNFVSIPLSMDSSWLARFSQKVHLQYYEDARIIKKLILD